MILESTLTCPNCGTAKTETMPTDACIFFYECTGCGELLRPKPGDCCVFCSYGSVRCPPLQAPGCASVCCESEESRLSTEIRRGVHRPDWSVVTTSAARAARLGRDRARNNLSETWAAPLSAPHDLAWRTVLELFGALGRPPDVTEISERSGLPQERIGALLIELETHDRLGLDRATGAIAHAYPFTARAGEHRVELRGRTLNALCAIDALGVGGMHQSDVKIASRCRHCATAIEIGTAEGGKMLSYAQPADAVVWYDLAYSQSAATSCCPSIAFFCGGEHCQQWLTSQIERRMVYRLTLNEALEVGRAIFEPVLATAEKSIQEGCVLAFQDRGANVKERPQM